MKKKCLSILLATLLFSCQSSLSSMDSSFESSFIEDDYEREDVDENNDFFVSLNFPKSYRDDTVSQGSVDVISYETRSYALESLKENEGKQLPLTKSMKVYLPASYDESKTYEILYLMHGTAAFQNYWFSYSTTLQALNYMMEKGISRETIVVTPTYYSIPENYPGYEDEYFDWFNDPNADLWANYFHIELMKDIIPLIEKKYHTYANYDTSDASLTSSRDHRALAGLSRGAYLTTAVGVDKYLDCFSYFGCFSGCGKDIDSTISHIKENLQYPIRYWYFATGTKDVVNETDIYSDVTTFYDTLKQELPDILKEEENTFLVIHPNGSHSYQSWILDLINFMMVAFK